ncbi:hypothetical protein TSUD_42770 [Trifolium subterraneum]|uniref:Uncharacterized protein n=1 Tax=Trifolium subterraneum TaxID=3900 RepID=A0A2Z6LHE6_TRISU|nr:hypothetical protein TSUD_42770 [Trifolium subterraneum]
MDVEYAGSFNGECVDGLVKEKQIVSSANFKADYPQLSDIDREIRLLMQITFRATYKLIP